MITILRSCHMGEWCYRNGGTEFCVFQLSLLSPFWTFKTSDHKQFFCIYPHLLLLLGWKKEGNRSPVPRQGMSNIGPTGWMWPSEAHYFSPLTSIIFDLPQICPFSSTSPAEALGWLERKRPQKVRGRGNHRLIGMKGGGRVKRAQISYGLPFQQCHFCHDHLHRPSLSYWAAMNSAAEVVLLNGWPPR